MVQSSRGSGEVPKMSLVGGFAQRIPRNLEREGFLDEKKNNIGIDKRLFTYRS